MERIHNRNALASLAFTTILLLLFSMTSIFLTDYSKAAGSIVYVDESYLLPHMSDGSIGRPFTNIQSAIDSAEEGDTVFVYKGTYSGFEIDKNITVKGESITNTFISGRSKTSYLIDLTGSYASIESFKIWDITPTTHRKAVLHVSSSASHVSIIGILINQSVNGYGIEIEGNNTLLEDNKICNTRGVNLIDAGVSTIFDNFIYKCGDNPAVRLANSDNNHIEKNTLNDSKYGIYIINSENNKIVNNTIFNNSYAGVKIEDGLNDSVENNTIYDNIKGVDVSSLNCKVISNNIYSSDICLNIGSDSGLVKENIITKSSVYGINTEKSSNDNIIFDNTFKNKNSGLYANEEGSNNWYNIDLDQGNYWDDFLGPDPDNESTLDSLDSSVFYYRTGGVLDKYPKGKYQKRPVISNPNPSHLESGVDLQPALSVKVTDPDKGTMDVSFFYRKDNESHFIQSVENVRSGDRASIPFFSLEENKNAVYSYIGAGYDYICEWYVEVTDQYSKTSSSKYLYSTVTSPLDNEKPIADVGGPYQEYEINNEISFDGSDSYDPDGDIAFYRWTFGDGTSVVNVKKTSHQYSEENIYEVTLTIIDDNGSSDTDTTYVSVLSEKPNSPPVPIISSSLKSNVGEQVVFTSSSTDSDGDSLSCVWEIEGAIYSGSTVTYVFNETGNYIVMLTVSDEEINTSSLYSIEINEKVEETSGFELILLIISILTIVIIAKYKKES